MLVYIYFDQRALRRVKDDPSAADWDGFVEYLKARRRLLHKHCQRHMQKLLLRSNWRQLKQPHPPSQALSLIAPLSLRPTMSLSLIPDARVLVPEVVDAVYYLGPLVRGPS